MECLKVAYGQTFPEEMEDTVKKPAAVEFLRSQFEVSNGKERSLSPLRYAPRLRLKSIRKPKIPPTNAP